MRRRVSPTTRNDSRYATEFDRQVNSATRAGREPPYVRPADRKEDVLHNVLVAEALSSLSRAHREVLTETVMRNRSVNEAADILGIPLDTVKTRVYYALRALRIVLEERGVTT